MEGQRWLDMPLILGRSGTQFVTMAGNCQRGYCGALLVESYCKESNISDTSRPRYLFPSYLIKIWLSVWRHHLANLHILKTWISLERKEIFENGKQRFPTHTDCLSFLNGFDRKDSSFVILPLQHTHNEINRFSNFMK